MKRNRINLANKYSSTSCTLNVTRAYQVTVTCCDPTGQFRQGPDLLWHASRWGTMAAQVAVSTHSGLTQWLDRSTVQAYHRQIPTLPGIIPITLNPCTRWRWVVSLTLRPNYHQYPLNGGPLSSQGRYGWIRDDRNFCPFPEIKPRTAQPIHRPVSAMTDSHQLYKHPPHLSVHKRKTGYLNFSIFMRWCGH